MSNVPASSIRTQIAIGENGFYRVVIEGAGSAKDLSKVVSKIAVFPDSEKELWIATDVKLDLSSAELIALADLAKDMPSRPKQVAIVANDDLTYGLGRIYAGHRETPDSLLNVFRDEKSALEWLGLQNDSTDLEPVGEDDWQYHQSSASA